jgi:hypothetical protein
MEKYSLLTSGMSVKKDSFGALNGKSKECILKTKNGFSLMGLG